MRLRPIGWTPAECAALAETWPLYSASHIAKKLGRTRNAIIGKANRMGLAPKAPHYRAALPPLAPLAPEHQAALEARARRERIPPKFKSPS